MSRVSVLSPSQDAVSPKDAAALLGLSERFLQDMRRLGNGPRYAKMGHRTIRYPIAALRKWLEEQTVGNTSEALERDRVSRQGVGRE